MRAPSAFLLALLLSLSASNAEDITVDLNGTGDFTEIQPAIDAAQAGCTVASVSVSFLKVPHLSSSER